VEDICVSYELQDGYVFSRVGFFHCFVCRKKRAVLIYLLLWFCKYRRCRSLTHLVALM
jgi:hypothetical protein